MLRDRSLKQSTQSFTNKILTMIAVSVKRFCWRPISELDLIRVVLDLQLIIFHQNVVRLRIGSTQAERSGSLRTEPPGSHLWQKQCSTQSHHKIIITIALQNHNSLKRNPWLVKTKETVVCNKENWQKKGKYAC